MSEASVREVQHHFARVLKRIARGEEVTVTRRGKMVARIVPPHPASPHGPVAWPDFLGRMRDLKGKIQGPSLSETILEEREERA